MLRAGLDAAAQRWSVKLELMMQAKSRKVILNWKNTRAHHTFKLFLRQTYLGLCVYSILRPLSTLLLLSAFALVGCGVLRPAAPTRPVELDLMPAQELNTDSLQFEQFTQRYLEARAQMEQDSLALAAEQLRNLFQDLSDSLYSEGAHPRLDSLRRVVAGDLVRLLPEAPMDSSSGGIHSLDFTIAQFADSLAGNTLMAVLLEQEEQFADTSLLQELEEMELKAEQDPLHPMLPGIPEAEHRRVSQMIDYFTTGKGRRYYKIWLERYPEVAPTIKRVLHEQGMPEDLIFLSMIESGFRTTARSRVRATGPWQFMAGTARVFDLRVDYWIDERVHLELATEAAARFLRSLYLRYDDWYLALAAYNWGPGRVDRGIRRAGGRKDYWTLPRMPAETRNYIPTFLAARHVFQHREEYGFSLQESQTNAPEMEAVWIKGALNLEQLAEMLGVRESELKAWNPQLMRFCTPPEGGNLYLPVERVASFKEELAELPDSAYQDWVRHKVQRGNTLSGIAARYRVPLSAVLRANKLSSRSVIRPGQMILVPLAPGTTPRAAQGPVKVRPDGVPCYTVQSGDALSLIAQRHKLSVRNLKRWNDLSSSRIYPGQILMLADPEKTASNSSSSLATQTPRPDNAASHTVRRGENPSSIAAHYGMQVPTLLSWNGLNSRDSIFPGQRLWVRDTNSTRADASAETTDAYYTVRRGDNLSLIAEQHGMGLSELRNLNGLASNVIQPGQRLKVHVETPQASASDAVGPQPQTEQAAAERPETNYTVRRGDNLSTIASRYGMELAELRRLNELQGNRIHPGQKLRVHAREQVATAPQADVTHSVTQQGAAPAKQSIEYYTVKRGDNLSRIAERHGLSLSELRSLNNLRGSVIRPGQRLKVRSENAAHTHRVSRGDTLWDIARLYETSVDELKRMNSLQDGQALLPGQVLVIRENRQ